MPRSAASPFRPSSTTRSETRLTCGSATAWTRTDSCGPSWPPSNGAPPLSVSTRKVRFVNPGRLYGMLKEELDQAYFEVMEKGDLIDRGQLRSFEENLAGFVGTKYAVGLNSGYDALQLSLRAAGVGPGDEVIVPAHTFVATASAVVNVGARPVLVDVLPDFNLDISLVEDAITPDTRAIIPVHLNGQVP